MIHTLVWFVVTGLLTVASYLLADILIPDNPFGPDHD